MLFPKTDRPLPFLALLCMVAPLSAGASDEASLCDHKPGERLRAEVAPATDHFESGAPIAADLELELLRAAASLRVVTSGSGALASSAQEFLVEGPWTAGAVERVPLALPPVGVGSGAFHVRVTALDDFGAAIYGRGATLHALADADGVWLSGSSTTDLARRRLAHLRGAGQLSGSAFQAAVSALSQGSAATDQVPHGPVVVTPAQELLDAAFAGIQDSQGFGQVHALGTGTTATGTVLWTDGAGNTHPLAQAAVEVLQGTTVLGASTTNSAGQYTVPLGTASAVTAKVRVFARSAVADIKPDGAGAVTYRVDSADTNIAAGATGTVNVTIGNTTNTESAFSVHAAMVMIGGYASTLAGSMPSTVDTRFPTTRSTSLFDSSVLQLHILQGDRRDWDVIHHEYGHYFMNVHKFVNSPGGSHSFETNMAAQPGRNKDTGTRLAWGEGWPTFFGIAGQQRMGGKAMNIPGVGDTVYSDSEDVSPTLNLDIEAKNGVGEDDEVSVMTALWDLFDGPRDGKDQVTLSDTSMFQSFKSAVPTRLGAAWEALAAPMTKRDRTKVGAVLGQAKVAPELTAPADKFEATNTPPAFTWKANGGGAPNPLNDFKLVFYSSDFNTEILSIPVGNVTTFTPTQPQWDTVRAGGTVVRWVVEGKNTSAPATPGGTLDFYWSEARTIGGIGISFVVDDTGSMGQEIGAVRSALQLYIDLLAISLAPGEEPPTIQLVTFKDSVSERIVSNDLDAVKAQVNGLSAGGGGDCPEAGAQAIEFAGTSLSSGGIMLFATDASSQPGVDLATVISELKSKGIRVHTILSGDCTGIFASAGGGVAADIVATGPQGWMPDASFLAGGDEEKPGDDDLEQTGIDDPGQEPLDDHGGSFETATLLIEGDAPASGRTSSGDVDFFAVDLEAGKPYAIRFQTTGSSATVRLFDTDGTTQLQLATANSAPRAIAFVPDEAGRFFVSLESFSSVPYVLSVAEDPLILLATAQEMFSTISAETGGVFTVQDGVNSGETTEYVASVFNIMAGTVQPTVIVANPNNLPQDASFSISLTGNRTNWRDGTEVEILADGVTVGAIDVISSTELTALVTVAEDATIGFSDVVVRTALGEENEEARGKDIVEIVGPVTSPTLLSVQPATVSRGDVKTVTLFGAKTEWDATSTLSFGDEVTVDSVTFVSPQELVVALTVADNARIGFRTAIVSTDGKPDDVQNRAIFVFASDVGIADIRQISPAQTSRGARAVVSVEAENVDFVDGVTTADFGPDIEVLDVAVIDPLHADVTVRVGLAAQIGFRDVALSTDGETAVLVKGFFVDDFASVRALSGGTQKLSQTLAAGGVEVFEFDADGGAVLERLFVVAFGDGSNDSVLPPDPEVSLLAPSGQVVATGLAVGGPVDFAEVGLSETGTYRIVIQDAGGAGGAFKGTAFLAEEPAP